MSNVISLKTREPIVSQNNVVEMPRKDLDAMVTRRALYNTAFLLAGITDEEDAASYLVSVAKDLRLKAAEAGK